VESFVEIYLRYLMCSLGCIMAAGVEVLSPTVKNIAASKIQKWWRARKSKAEGFKLLAQHKENEVKRKTEEVGALKIQKWWRARNGKAEGIKLLAQHKANEIIKHKAKEIKRRLAENLKRKAKQGILKGAGKCVRWLICTAI
jgi:hypothetical protein